MWPLRRNLTSTFLLKSDLHVSQIKTTFYYTTEKNHTYEKYIFDSTIILNKINSGNAHVHETDYELIQTCYLEVYVCIYQ